ncbi:hypothetical protein GCM10012275_42020 [Longimycelium tulufanense]|uniref:Uncharacterized protein n=1 Tax=Longimycelium tulufanense TaxID=907463 RepID=A0A8J3CAW5_9PSEU|nr:hypothetical protein [Longimycelium tulufanense]GGM67091.1 hypothetical protein GCM10012275_42020 [Longimycelium tulufanense]
MKPYESSESRVAEYIRRVVDDAPPLTADQRHRLAVLLRPASEKGRAA